MLWRRARRFVVCALLGVLALAAPARAGDEPSPVALPEPATFLRDVRERLHSDEYLLEKYTFNEKHTELRLDGKGKIKKTTSDLYQVYPSPEPGHTYRKLVAREGVPLPAEELAKEDREQEKKESQASARQGGDDERKRAAWRAERQRKESEATDELFRLYDIRMTGRETLEGRDTIVFDFRPRVAAETATRAGKVLKKFAGRAWIDEQDRQLVRVEAESVDDLSFGLGFLAKLKKGAQIQLQRRKVNDEVWLPSKSRFVAHARLFLVKGIHVDALSEYSDYRKFSVATDAAVTPKQEK